MRIRKVAAVTMAACLAAGALAGCGSKKSDEKVIKIGVFERPPVRTEAEAIRKYWYPLCQRDAPHRQHRRRGICCQTGGGR